jgi:phosphotriesterase-related protein
MSTLPQHILTVLGAVPATLAGPIDAHGHIWIEPEPGVEPGGPVLRDLYRSLSELRAYGAAGGVALVDCQPGGAGRDGRKLAWLSRTSGVPIVACTGFHRRRYHPAASELWARSEDELTAYFLRELDPAFGLAECRDHPQPVAAGFLKVAIEATLEASPLVALAAAAQAAAHSGAAVQIHTEQGAQAEAVVAFFLERGVAPGQLLICHIDKRPDHGLHVALAQAGVSLEYDTFYRPKYDPERNLWPLIDHMLSTGLAGSVSLATDMADSAQWAAYGGGPGLTAFPTAIPARLAERGVPAESIWQMTGGNILRLLSRPKN